MMRDPILARRHIGHIDGAAYLDQDETPVLRLRRGARTVTVAYASLASARRALRALTASSARRILDARGES